KAAPSRPRTQARRALPGPRHLLCLPVSQAPPRDAVDVRPLPLLRAPDRAVPGPDGGNTRSRAIDRARPVDLFRSTCSSVRWTHAFTLSLRNPYRYGGHVVGGWAVSPERSDCLEDSVDNLLGRFGM